MKELVPADDTPTIPAVEVTATLVKGTLILKEFVPAEEIVWAPAVFVSATLV